MDCWGRRAVTFCFTCLNKHRQCYGTRQPPLCDLSPQHKVLAQVQDKCRHPCLIIRVCQVLTRYCCSAYFMLIRNCALLQPAKTYSYSGAVHGAPSPNPHGLYPTTTAPMRSGQPARSSGNSRLQRLAMSRSLEAVPASNVPRTTQARAAAVLPQPFGASAPCAQRGRVILPYPGTTKPLCQTSPAQAAPPGPSLSHYRALQAPQPGSSPWTALPWGGTHRVPKTQLQGPPRLAPALPARPQASGVSRATRRQDAPSPSAASQLSAAPSSSAALAVSSRTTEPCASRPGFKQTVKTYLLIMLTDVKSCRLSAQ